MKGRLKGIIMEFETIICFETHVELETRSKLFCTCPVMHDASPNTNICPICTGHPGVLPVVNRKAVEYAIRAGLALNCRINPISRFARKNYFYPDLPKGYQISQYETPFCEEGYLEIETENGPYPVGIKRIHLEEDAGKLIHSTDSFESSTYSLVDFNRASVPLLEIVNDHERNPIRSATEARTYLETLRQLLIHIGISRCIMEKGQMRCDVNISLKKRGEKGFGNRTEIKNMSSFKAIVDALNYEIERQRKIIIRGDIPKQETRLFDEKRRITVPMRTKEDAPDYRYFPDPDLVEIQIDEKFIEEIRSQMPELPQKRLKRLVDQYGISKDEAAILIREREITDFFEEAAKSSKDIKRLSRWIINELFRLLKENSLTITRSPITPRTFSQLIELLTNGEITDPIGKIVLEEMIKSGKDPFTIIRERELQPLEESNLVEIVREVLNKNRDIIRKIISGDPRPINFLVGQVMKSTGSKADPKEARRIIEELISPCKE